MWYDEDKNVNRVLRYAVNQKTPFEDEQDGNAITINLDPKVKTNRDYIEIEFQMPNAITPQAIGMGTDIRKLGFGLVSATFE